MYTLKLKIVGLPRTPNDLLGRHWTVKNKHAKKWKKIIEEETLWRVPGIPLNKCKIKCVRHSFKQMDFDGLAGSFKAVVDALVKCGIIVDDNPDVIDIEYFWEKAPMKRGFITLELEGI